MESNDDVALRAYVECDGCHRKATDQNDRSENPSGATPTTAAPLKCCKRCRCTYYCSVECQRKHWKEEHKADCRDINWMRSEHTASGAAACDPKTLHDAVNTACGICLQEPITNAVVLSQCRHAFCLPCLRAWQDYRPMPTNPDELYELPSSQSNKSCPFCRREIEKPAIDQILEGACVLAARARKVDASNVAKADRTDTDSEFYDLALAEVKKVSEMAPNHLGALFVQAQVLVDIRPTEAVTVLQRALQLDAQGFRAREWVNQQLDRVKMAMDMGDDDEADRLMQPIEDKYGADMSGMPAQYHGQGPYRLFPVYHLLAQAQEAAQQWEKAKETYQTMCQATIPSESIPIEQHVQPDPPQTRMIYFGLSRCAFQLHVYGKAMNAAQVALCMNRHFPGVHKLVALPQRAIVRLLERTDAASLNEIQAKHHLGPDIHDQNMMDLTWDDVVDAMRRGVLYETPWDDGNRQANRIFLQELLDEQANVTAKMVNVD